MAKRSTRNKIKFQAKGTADDLRHAQEHMIELAALAEEQSPYIDEKLPPFVAALKFMIDAFTDFRDGL